jgi:catechol 2,3-dioxygenase-like lactoylglutathione lyase family enzyme
MEINKLNNKEFICNGPSRKIIITKGNNKTLSYAGMVCRSEKNLARFKSFLVQNQVQIKEFKSEIYKTGSFSILDPDDNQICFGILSDNEKSSFDGINGPLQHVTFSSFDVEAFQEFYEKKLGFQVTDRVVKTDGTLATCFTTSNHEHHTIACFRSDKKGIDHHSYEAGEWDHIKTWCDHFASHDIQLMWGPGRHGPGNNLFVFIEDADGNWIEISAELETVHGRPIKNWPQTERTLNLWGKAIMRS